MNSPRAAVFHAQTDDFDIFHPGAAAWEERTFRLRPPPMAEEGAQLPAHVLELGTAEDSAPAHGLGADEHEAWHAEQRGRFEKCYTDLSELLRLRSVRNTVSWTLANKGFSEMTLNLLVSWQRLDLHNYFVVALDPEAAEWLEGMGTPCYITEENLRAPPSGAEDFQTFLSPTYLKFMRAKPEYTLHIARAGFDQFYADADMVWLRDPLEFVLQHPMTPVTDYWVQDDTYMPCGGFYWLRACPGSILFFERQLENLEKKPQQNEQYGQWEVMKAYKERGEEYRWRYLPKELFPNGRVYFQWMTDENFGLRPFIVHSNWIVGYRAKVHRFRERGLWYLDGDEYFGAGGGKFLTFSWEPRRNITEYRVAMRNALALAFHLGRALILPQLPCQTAWMEHASAPETPANVEHCDVTNWAVSQVGPFTQFNLEKLYKFVDPIVPIRAGAVLRDERFLRHTGGEELHVWIDGADRGQVRTTKSDAKFTGGAGIAFDAERVAEMVRLLVSPDFEVAPVEVVEVVKTEEATEEVRRMRDTCGMHIEDILRQLEPFAKVPLLVVHNLVNNMHGSTVKHEQLLELVKNGLPQEHVKKHDKIFAGDCDWWF